ncbi:MBL fold metallo-hydrolase [Paenibacillus sp. 598K]|uniref:MBL fold metallo-hydrolase n=1 Tax=Paenibacillus sp. 598K TaxID=1117987 RepID=UPI000FFA090C|nr:MBL fold metallo-hydrolase [Paenibacillus sp. 598K]GBF76215.1 MBL fold metallo-hydrolase [Paenibacillus sp. 598K]
MDIQMIGTGSAFSKRYYNTNALVYTEDMTLMIDCGVTAPMALHQLGKPLSEIDAILITHIHADHVGGLEEFAFRMKFQYDRKPVLYIAETLVQPIWDHTLKGGLVQQEWQRLEDFFDVRPLTPGARAQLAPALAVELIETPHIPGKTSYSVYMNDHFFYSADMRFNPGLLDKLLQERGCDVIFHDCQLQSPGLVHASLEELLTLPDEVQERIWLVHYADERDEHIGRTGKMLFLEQHRRYSMSELIRTTS